MVILGEIHDNPLHHVNQARGVAALRPGALVFEMLTPAQAALADTGTRSSAADLDAVLHWEEGGWPDFAMYYPIIAAAPRAKIFGAAQPDGDVRRAVSDGAAEVFGPGAEDYGLTVALAPADAAEREAEQAEVHCGAMPKAMLGGMVEAQRLRDAAFARVVAAAAAVTDGPVAVITGSGHARTDRGIPVALGHAMPGLKVLSVGQIEGPSPDAAPYDLWIATPAAPREDPCLAFRKG